MYPRDGFTILKMCSRSDFDATCSVSAFAAISIFVTVFKADTTASFIECTFPVGNLIDSFVFLGNCDKDVASIRLAADEDVKTACAFMFVIGIVELFFVDFTANLKYAMVRLLSLSLRLYIHFYD
jgi:hypothetical protein